MDEKLKELFSKNLVNQLLAHGETQATMTRRMKISSATASDWCNGRKMPRVDKIQALCNWLGIELSDLLEDKSDQDQNSGQVGEYYLDTEARELAEFLHKNPEYKVLFDASRKVRKEDIEFVRQFIERMS